jgi:hypothetical protein
MDGDANSNYGVPHTEIYINRCRTGITGMPGFGPLCGYDVLDNDIPEYGDHGVFHSHSSLKITKSYTSDASGALIGSLGSHVSNPYNSITYTDEVGVVTDLIVNPEFVSYC